MMSKKNLSLILFIILRSLLLIIILTTPFLLPTMALLDNTGPFDKVSVACALGFTTAWLFGVVLCFEGAEDFLRLFYTVFGLFDAGGSLTFDKGHVAVASGAYLLPVYGMCLPMAFGTEGTVHRHSRQVFAFWVWMGWLLYNIKYLFVDTHDAFSGSPANYFWIANNGFMVLCHYLWVGDDILGKFHLKHPKKIA